MEFSKTFTDFPSRVHRLIYLTALRQTPLVNSLKETQGVDESVLDSCKQYHEFVMDMLSLMYQNPDSFGMKPGQYEVFLGGKKENAMKQLIPLKTLEIRSETCNTVPSYFRLLHRFAQFGTANDQSLTIAEETYLNIRKNYDADYDKKKNTEKSIPYSVRISALNEVGLNLQELADGSILITNEKYPNMFLAMSLLSKAGWGKKPYGEHNFIYTDFRQIWNEKHLPNYEDFMRVLPDEQKEVIDQVRESAKALGLRESCKTYWKVDYHYKSKHVMLIDSEFDWQGEKNPRCNNTRIRVNGGNTDHYIDNIASKGDDFIQYFRKHMNYCTACSTSHIGWQRDLFGHKVRLCCEPHFRITNPSMSDVDNVVKFIQLRNQEILFEKESK